MRWFLLVLLVLLVLLQYQLWFAGGMDEVWRMQEAVEQQRKENEALRERNAKLAAEVRDLKEGQEAIEERARNELGMIKRGEVMYQVVEPGDSKPAETP